MDVVDLFRTALGVVRWRTRGELGIRLVKANLHLRLEQARDLKAGVGGKLLYVIPVEGEVSRSWTKTHDLTLSLTPHERTADLGEPETEELADAIVDLARAAKEIRQRVATEFNLDSFGISAEVGVSRGGKLQIVAGGERASGTSHTVDLSFRPL